MLMTKERRPAIRTLRGWAISVLHEAGAIRECEELTVDRCGRFISEIARTGRGSHCNLVHSPFPNTFRISICQSAPNSTR
jgi:hypothetical protein